MSRSRAPSGVLLRRLAPAALVAPVALALLCHWGEQAGLYGPGFGSALLVASNSLVSVVLIAWTARAISRSDELRQAAEHRRLYAQLEQQVQERTAELEAANRELEAFSSSVAHDLRAPLRAISAFSEALLEDAAGRLAPDDLRRATQIRDAARRMGELIPALLELARISRTEPRRRRVDVSELARTIVGGLRAAQPERDAEVVIDDGLIAFADPKLLEIVLTNLLGNAWKFTGKRARARIELSVMPAGPPPVYVVRDNGAGFDPAQAGKLFGVFQRLHTADEFEGTGVGLATVQRIVARHGGVIWAEAEPDRGAAFYFTLQAPPVTDRAASRRSPS